MASQAPRQHSQDAAASDPLSRLIDPATLMRIRNLELRARLVVEGFLAGLHRSPYHGFSVEFSEYREYAPGDDLRYLDWRVHARTDRYYIKRFEDETNLRCHMLIDLSRSMQFAGGEYSKADYARTLAATVAYFLLKQKDAVGLTTFSDRLLETIPARFRVGQMHQILVTLERELDGTGTDLGLPIETLANAVVKRGVVALISDLLTPPQEFLDSLRLLRSRGHDVIVFRVLDPAEKNLSFTQPTTFFDLESGRQRYVDPDAVREDYVRQFNEHAERIESGCRGMGVALLELTTDRPLELALFDFLTARLRQPQSTRRADAPRGHSPGGAR